MLRLTILIQSPVAMLMPTHHILSGKVFKLELHCIHALEPTQELNMDQTLAAYNIWSDCVVPLLAQGVSCKYQSMVRSYAF